MDAMDTFPYSPNRTSPARRRAVHHRTVLVSKLLGVRVSRLRRTCVRIHCRRHRYVRIVRRSVSACGVLIRRLWSRAEKCAPHIVVRLLRTDDKQTARESGDCQQHDETSRSHLQLLLTKIQSHCRYGTACGSKWVNSCRSTRSLTQPFQYLTCVPGEP